MAIGSAFFALTSLLTSAAQITLAWDASTDPSVTGYRVYYGSGSLAYSNAVSAGNATTLTISNLVAGTTYYFAATAYDGNGLESDFSAEVAGTVNQPNQAPTLDPLLNLTLNENAGAQTVNLSGISSGAANENQTLTITAASSNPGLIPAPAVTYTSPNSTGSLRFTPVSFGFGSATITVSVNDGGSSNNIVARTFTVTVNPVNQAPTFNAVANVTVNENAAAQTVNLSGISSGAANENQTLTVTASSSNPALVPAPAVTYTSPNSTGSLRFTPVSFGFGSATITVSVNDGGSSNNILARTFTVTVNPVNQAPTLNALANVTVNENAVAQTINLLGISSGAANENQTLTVTASSSNPALIPAPAVSYTSPNASGSLIFTPAASTFGTATLTVTVNDGGASNNIVSRSFIVTVNQVNQPPTISSLTNAVIAVNKSTAALPFTIGDPESPVSTLALSGSSDNSALVLASGIVFGGNGANRTVTITPLSGQTGTANITVTVSDGVATASSSLLLSVRPRPQPPGGFHITKIN